MKMRHIWVKVTMTKTEDVAIKVPDTLSNDDAKKLAVKALLGYPPEDRLSSSAKVEWKAEALTD